jgi:hypothetical protein
MNWQPNFTMLLSSCRLCVYHSGVCASGYECAVNGKCKIIIIIVLITAALNFSYNPSYTENLDQRSLWKSQSIIHLNYVITHL